MDLLDAHPVTARQLQYVVAVADLGGFRRAAEACHVSQPSLSAQIAQVEAALGLQIFERGRQPARVSAAGAPVLEQARRVLAAMRDLREAARRHADPLHGTLRIGVIPTVCPYLLPDIAPALRRRLPGLTIEWSEDRTHALVRQVASGALDAAVVAVESDLGDLETAVLGRDPFVIAAAPGNRLVQSSSPARVDALDGAEVLLLEDGHCLRDQALAVCARAGAGEPGLRATSLSTLVQMVGASGTRVTLLPAMALPVENRRGQIRVRPFVKNGPGRTLVLAWRRGSAVKIAAARVAEVVARALTHKIRPLRAHRPPRSGGAAAD